MILIDPIVTLFMGLIGGIVQASAILISQREKKINHFGTEKNTKNLINGRNQIYIEYIDGIKVKKLTSF